MKTHLIRRTLTAISASILLHGLSAAGQLINGGFETYGGTDPGSSIGVGISPWVITSGGIDIILPNAPYYWQPADGVVSISLNWTSPATISQSITTMPGVAYTLRFSMAAEIRGGPALRTMDVLWNGSVVVSPSFAYTGQEPNNMGWTVFTYTVQGTGTDVLAFRSTTPANYGPALDAVSLTPVLDSCPPLSIRFSEVELCWPTSAGRLYQLQYRSELTTNAWVSLYGTNIVGTSSTVCFPERLTQPQRFYRLLCVTNGL